MTLNIKFNEKSANLESSFDETNQTIHPSFGQVIEVGSTVNVDPTLTIEGAAADAKAVGDVLQATYNKLNSNTTYFAFASRNRDAP